MPKCEKQEIPFITVSSTLYHGVLKK